MAEAGDHYTTLKVPRDASFYALRKSYKELALELHPDKNPNNIEGAKISFQKLAEAYAVLSDEHKRKKYDLELKNRACHQLPNGSDEKRFPNMSNSFFSASSDNVQVHYNGYSDSGFVGRSHSPHIHHFCLRSCEYVQADYVCQKYLIESGPPIDHTIIWTNYVNGVMVKTVKEYQYNFVTISVYENDVLVNKTVKRIVYV